MDFRRLKYFVGVVEAGSFTKAASWLHVAQSALSLHVRQLELEFGTSLLVRDRSGVTPTPAGIKLMDHARTILHQVSLAERALTKKSSPLSGEVTIGIGSGVARAVVAELLPSAKQWLPDVHIRIFEGASDSVEERIGAGRLNLAILERNLESNGASTVLAREEFCLVTPPDCTSSDRIVKLSDLNRYPLAIQKCYRKSGNSVDDAVSQYGCNLNVVFELDSLLTIIDMIIDRKVSAILTPSSVHREASLNQVRIVRIVDPVITRSIVLRVNPRDERSLQVAAVRRLVSQVVQRQAQIGKWSTTCAQAEMTPEKFDFTHQIRSVRMPIGEQYADALEQF